jgi:hypothetical protein
LDLGLAAAGRSVGFAVGLDVGLRAGGGGGVADRPVGASLGIGGRTLPLPEGAPLLGAGRFTGIATVSSRWSAAVSDPGGA